MNDEAAFMDSANWGETRAGNSIYSLEFESDDGLYTRGYTVVIYPSKRAQGKYDFVIYIDGIEGMTWSRNSYSSQERARAWAWTRLELLT
jgi:hypothetical protein